MNQSAVIDDLQRNGWISFQPKNDLGWKFFMRRNRELDHAYFGHGHNYITVFPSGRTAEGIIETRHQRYERRKREILFRDFRDWI